MLFSEKQYMLIIFGRYAFRQYMICHHSSLNKVEHGHAASNHATGCKAFVSCNIKLIKKNTRKNDSFLTQVSNSCVTVIIMSLCWYYNICESHSTTFDMVDHDVITHWFESSTTLSNKITTVYSNLLHREAVENVTFVLSCVLAAHQNYLSTYSANSLQSVRSRPWKRKSRIVIKKSDCLK